jgi:hypothetical protein
MAPAGSRRRLERIAGEDGPEPFDGRGGKRPAPSPARGKARRRRALGQAIAATSIGASRHVPLEDDGKQVVQNRHICAGYCCDPSRQSVIKPRFIWSQCFGMMAISAQ